MRSQNETYVAHQEKKMKGWGRDGGGDEEGKSLRKEGDKGERLGWEFHERNHGSGGMFDESTTLRKNIQFVEAILKTKQWKHNH